MNGDFIPDCVPEYVREQQKKYERECELHWQRLEQVKGFWLSYVSYLILPLQPLQSAGVDSIL